MLTELTLMLELKYSSRSPSESAQPQWKIPVLAAQAVNDVGMTELFQAIENHHQFLSETGELERRRKARRREELLSRVEYEVRRRLTAKTGTDPVLTRLIEEVGEGKIDPHTASARILGSELLKNEA
jgi:LAO/AO transport system kinase